MSKKIYASGIVVFLLGLGCASGPEKHALTHTEKARLYVEMANGALIEKDPTGALQRLIAAEKEDDSLPEIYHTRAIAYFEKHDLKSAIEAAKKALKIKPDYTDANNTLGKLYMDSGDLASAIAPLTLAANDPLYRESYKPLTNLGILHYRRGEFPESELYLNRAIEDSPQLSCVAHYYRGHLELRKSDFKEAIRDYEQATQRICASFADAQFAQGIAYERSKQYNLARRKFLEIQQRYPNTKLADDAMDHLRGLP